MCTFPLFSAFHVDKKLCDVDRVYKIYTICPYSFNKLMQLLLDTWVSIRLKVFLHLHLAFCVFVLFLIVIRAGSHLQEVVHLKRSKKKLHSQVNIV